MIGKKSDLAGTLSECAQTAAELIQNSFGNKADEEAVSDQFLGAFKSQILSTNFSDVTVRAETTTHRGKNPVETRTGADMAIRYVYEEPSYSYESGLLLQAKYYDTYDDDIDSLRKDCGKMLSYTDSSYIITYSPTSFYHFPASAFYGIEEDLYKQIGDKNIRRLIPYRKPKAFYERFFRGIIGDQIIPKNWDYFMDNSDSFNRRPDPDVTFKPDGGEEVTEEFEGGNGLEITVTNPQ